MRIVSLSVILCAVLSAFSGCATPMTPEEESAKKLAEIQNADWHYQSASGYFQEHQVTLAIRELHIALEKDAEHIHALYLLGYIYMGRRDYNKAVGLFKRAIEVEPNFYDAINSLGAAYLAMERWDEAVALFEQLLEQPLYTSPELAHNNAGWAYYNMRKYPRALEHFRMATYLKPQFCLGFNNLGLTQQAMRNEQDAVRSYQKAIELCPTNYAEPHFNLAKIYQNLGEMNLAHGHFKRCTELSSGSSLGDRCREYLAY